MQLLFLATLVALAAWMVKTRDQGRRIALLGSHLGKYQIEKNMETLTQGYLRALGEDDAGRREQIWNLLQSTEQALCSQFERFAADFARVAEADARVSKLPVYLPFVAKLLPAATFDMRAALAIHARGICKAVQGNGDLSPRSKAYTVSAELFLMQHTCHWYCKSRTVASARMLARHKTSYQQLVASVAPATRAAYCVLLGRRPGELA
ncbi:MAG TPA: hypothetical protein VIM34_23025 [Burkholderiaceae bacterium]